VNAADNKKQLSLNVSLTSDIFTFKCKKKQQDTMGFNLFVIMENNGDTVDMCYCKHGFCFGVKSEGTMSLVLVSVKE